MSSSTLAIVGVPQDGGSTGLVLLIQFAAIIAIFWFLLIRPQRKAQQRHRQMLEALKRGDEVVTEGGIIGEVVHLREDRVTIRTADNTRLVITRQKIARINTGVEAESQEKG